MDDMELVVGLFTAGKTEAIEEIIVNLLLEKVDVGIISRSTGYNIKQIEAFEKKIIFKM